MTDREILALFHDETTKEKGFRLLLDKYQERLYWHVRRMVLSHEDADDVMQNFALKVWKGLANFRAEAQLFTWLYRIATNESLTLINRNKRHQAVPLVMGEEDEGGSIADTLASDPYFDGDEAELRLQRAIEKLPEKQKLVFSLRYYDELKYEEISDVLGTSVGALKASYHHAVKKIEESIKRN